MILGDLLDSRVLDDQGETLGHVVDVRLALALGESHDADDDGGPDDPPLADNRRRDPVERAEVVGLLISPRTGSSFLGYERTGVRSPWMIAALVRRLHRGTFLVAWEDVAAVDDDGVTLAEGFERLDPSLD